MTINTYMPSINNFLKGFQNGLPGMKDYQHASRLYIDDNYKLMPKQKFLFHVVFNTDETLFQGGFNPNERYQLNMLVKACDMPKFDMSYEEKVQYNKKMYAATRIAYEPVNITFHDDHADTVNAFWKKYYEYNIADSIGMNSDLTISNTKDDYYTYGDSRKTTKFGMDTPRKRQKPYLKGIEIFVLHKQRFTSMTLVNPVIGSFSHDNLDQADGAGVLNNTMQILYETVIYKAGVINRNNVPGFATINYDQSPSPLSVLGGGTNSIFGPGWCSGWHRLGYSKRERRQPIRGHTQCIKHIQLCKEDKKERCQSGIERYSQARCIRSWQTGGYNIKSCSTV